MLRQALQSVELEFQVDRALLLSSLYPETRKNPLAKVIFDRYKNTELVAVEPQSMQAMCYEFGVYYSMKEMLESVKKYASLPGGALIYQDFMIWWLNNEQIRYNFFLCLLFSLYHCCALISIVCF
jgi:hypothetical protein